MALLFFRFISLLLFVVGTIACFYQVRASSAFVTTKTKSATEKAMVIQHQCQKVVTSRTTSPRIWGSNINNRKYNPCYQKMDRNVAAIRLNSSHESSDNNIPFDDEMLTTPSSSSAQQQQQQPEIISQTPPPQQAPPPPTTAYVPPPPQAQARPPPAIPQNIERMDPLMASLTRDNRGNNDGVREIPFFGEVDQEALFLFVPAALFAVLGFLYSFVIAFQSSDQIVTSLASSVDNISMEATNRNNRVYDKNVCRGLCSSQSSDIDGMRNFMESITRSVRENPQETK